MQHMKVSGAVWPMKWSLGVKWLIIPDDVLIQFDLLMMST